MKVKEAKELFRAKAPTLSIFTTTVNITLFWLFVPVAFLFGAAWTGIAAGFRLGYRW